MVLASNAVMVLLYWDLGRSILEKQADQGWGSRVIDRLAADLREAFPEMKGFTFMQSPKPDPVTSVFPGNSYVIDLHTSLA